MARIVFLGAGLCKPEEVNARCRRAAPRA